MFSYYLILIVIVMVIFVVSVYSYFLRRMEIKNRIARTIQFSAPKLARLKKAEESRLKKDFKILLQALVDRWTSQDSKRSHGMQSMLANAGIRSKEAQFIYGLVRLLLPLFLLAIVLLIPYLRTDIFLIDGMVVVIATLMGLLLPGIWLKKQIKKYRLNIQKYLPDALAIMAICVEAGYSIDNILLKIADDFGDYSPALANELAITLAELKLVSDREIAWHNLAQRLELDDIKALVTALQQSEKYGTPLKSTLNSLTVQFRRQRLTRIELKAAKLPALLSLPLVLCFLPAIFCILVGPPIIRVLSL